MSPDNYYKRQARRVWLLGAVAILGLAVLIVWIVVARPSQPTTTSPSSATPSLQVTPGETAKDPRAVELSERVKAFEVVFRSFDWSDPTAREKELATYMTPEALAELLEAEHSLPQRQSSIDAHVTRTVKITSDPIGDFIDTDLAEASTDVMITSTQPGSDPLKYPVSSKTSWVLDQGVWLVSSVDPK